LSIEHFLFVIEERRGVGTGAFGHFWFSKAAAPNSESFRERELSGHALHTLREA